MATEFIKLYFIFLKCKCDDVVVLMAMPVTYVARG